MPIWSAAIAQGQAVVLGGAGTAQTSESGRYVARNWHAPWPSMPCRGDRGGGGITPTFGADPRWCRPRSVRRCLPVYGSP
jgi:hypothetical protein